MSLFDSLSDLTSNVIAVVAAPVQIVADVAVAVTTPIADGARCVADEVRDLLDNK